ncbi:MAG: hypothetical protein V3T83_22020, partial [Acidobacteriota bacterium]
SENEFVNQALRKLAYGKTQERILEIYLQEAQPFVRRAILFLLRDGQYVTWKGFGFEPENIKEIALDDPMDSVVRSAQQRQLIYRRDQAADALPWLSQAGDLPNCTLCIPLVFENSAPVVFYADGSDPIAINSLELLSHLTVLVLKNNYLHQLVNAQKEAAGEAVAGAEAALSPVVAEAPVEEPQEEAWQAPDEPEPEPEPEAEAEAEAPPPAEEWVEAGAMEEASQEEPQEADFEEVEAESASEAVDEPVPEPEPEPASEPYPDFDIPSEKKELDFDEELAAVEKEIDFEIDLDTAPEIEDWEAEAAGEQEEAQEELPAQSEEASAPEPQEPQEEVQPADHLEEEAPSEEPDLESEATSQAPDPPPSEPGAASPYEEASAPEEEASPEFEMEFEPEPESEAEPVVEATPAPELQEAAQEEPSEPALSSEEEKKAHDEARRFARLLVSEIKLYNEDEVEAGRQSGNLYQRLSRDINRSRDMYQKRVNPTVSRSVDYFHDEVVRILAKGDADLLGSDYSGPQTGE